MIRPHAKTECMRGIRVSPVTVLTRASTKWAPKEYRGFWPSCLISSPVSTVTFSPAGTSRARSSRHALTIAEPHDVVPIDPPATIAGGSALSPISTWTRSGATPSSSAAICVSTVRAPVPMSAAAIPTLKVSSSFRRAHALDGVRRAGYTAEATPVPTSHSPSRVAPGSGLRSLHPKRSAPSRRHATRLREVNGLPDSGSTSGSLRIRSSIGSMPHAVASSSIADSSAYMPGHSPGARIHDGVGTSSAASRWPVRRLRTSCASTPRSARRSRAASRSALRRRG